MIKQPTKNKWWRTVGRTAGWMVLIGVTTVATGLLILVVPVFGNQGLIVRSGSMAPAIGVGDLVVVRPHFDKEIKGRPLYTVGDVIAYKSLDNSGMIVTHRIAEVRGTESNVNYVTKGDANNTPDEGLVAVEQVIGRQIFLVPYIGKALAFGKTKLGYVAFVLLPALLVIGGEIRVIWREMRKGKLTGKQARLGRANRLIPEMADRVLKRQRKEEEVVMVLKPIVRREKMLVPLDSVVARLAVFAGAMIFMVPSTWALYTDSEVSADNTFTAGCWTQSTAPVHLYPPDGMVAGAGSHWVTSPYLDWMEATAACGGVIKYQYQSAHNAEFSPVAYSSGLLSLSQIAAPGTPDGVYWWHVRSYDGENYSAWSDPWRLTVDRSLGSANYVVISEVQIAGIGGADQDFVELYNPTSDDVNLINWDLRMRNSAGTESSLYADIDRTIQAHGYLLWATSDDSFDASVGADIFNGSNLVGGGSVALRDNDNLVIDQVAWGTGGGTQFVEGVAFGTNPGADESIERKAVSDADAVTMGPGGADVTRGNGFDSGDNALDFVLREESEPQNSVSSTESL
ncbi:MAG TPA: signal peptidase I [Candidatus Andersenbacteria bacterium]|nr:MAG: Bacterial Ig-like protein domain (Group 1)/fibronectin type III domain protein [Parcubacteria group bacterium GW2011_GWA2_45_14]OGY35787.1 MAG: signal peptidase I [Candidatus Andersenbacteria bacterium RIFCSPHIGHO2_02_FULL_46_16]OGY36664.1 MAG: signal peptidase I [Candidatus Andersenbacteria bacterium RIFCSPLOWO2_02_FULL_46_11]HBE90465.1 signal peptidase I [Candidatus Andersenbacteria bacterium]